MKAIHNHEFGPKKFFFVNFDPLMAFRNTTSIWRRLIQINNQNQMLTGRATRSNIISEHDDMKASETSFVPPQPSILRSGSTDAMTTSAPARRRTSTKMTASISSVPSPTGTRTWGRQRALWFRVRVSNRDKVFKEVKRRDLFGGESWRGSKNRGFGIALCSGLPRLRRECCAVEGTKRNASHSMNCLCERTAEEQRRTKIKSDMYSLHSTQNINRFCQELWYEMIWYTMMIKSTRLVLL